MSATRKRKREDLDLKTRYDVKYKQDNPEESTRKLAENL